MALIWLSIAAERSGYARSTFHHWVRSGRLPVHKFPGDKRTYVDEAELVQAILNRHAHYPKIAEPTPDMISVQDAAAAFGVHKGSLWYWISCGYITAHVYPADLRTYVPRADAERLSHGYKQHRKGHDIRPRGVGRAAWQRN